MVLNLYPVCHRGRDDCEPVHCIASEPEGITEEQFLNFDYDPPSFVCAGCNKTREVEQDIFVCVNIMLGAALRAFNIPARFLLNFCGF